MMQLELRNISKIVGQDVHIADVSLTFQSGTLNILLGPTLSGKTTLMRLMAGLEKPTAGKLFVDGRDVTGVAVQKRNTAMVYQQFINYPNLTVYDNIASPLKIAKVPRAEIETRVEEIASLLKLNDMLKRMPQELSGGQQQRTALARALVKGADLVLLDEPLANLDYKLREELREELPKIFSATGAIFVYATTEPMEALLLGGNTAALHEGRVYQFGPTLDVFHKPDNLTTAQTFADPPLNTLPVTKLNNRMLFKSHVEVPLSGKLPQLPDADYTIGFRPNHLYLAPTSPKAISVKAKVVVTEITGSDSYIHIDVAGLRWVVLAHSIQSFDVEETIEVFLDPDKFYVFDDSEKLVATPLHISAAGGENK
ncbi:MAG: ABC transporter ATP-binding protein [Desulfopila sp.]|jgi:glycerol transport system ATP-binding protein|nr:ABC transporter ATP-binding protein [Desulfopila sp.]